MSDPIIKFGFSAGVLAPTLHFRSDLEKYDLGLAEGRNWFVDYFGGASTRPGFEFLDYIQNDDEPSRLFSFKFNADIANNYAVLFGSGYIRFLQDGAYVLETAKSGTIAGDTITITAHGYSDGDWLKVDDRTVEVTGATTNTFDLLDPFGDTYTPLDASSVERIYTITSPYATSDLSALVWSQDKNEVYLTHVDYTRRKLTRTDHTNWTLTEVGDVGNNDSVSNLTANGASGSNGVLFAVVPVNLEGEEAPLHSDGMVLLTAVTNISAVAGTYRINWDPVDDTAYYNIYRSRIVPQNEANFGLDLGFLGRSYGAEFTDNNIVPDFTDSPLDILAPFEAGAISHINMTAVGSGYTSAPDVAVTGGGSGFDAVAIVNQADEVIGVRILNPGEGYTSPTVSFTGGGGSGATATASATAATGKNPACSQKNQQRRVYGGTLELPAGLFGSRSGFPDNFDASFVGTPDDPYIFTIDMIESTPIRHIRSYSEGFFAFTETSIHQIRGTDDAAIQTGSVRALPQTEEGCDILPPITIEREHLYLTSGRTEVNSLRPSNLPTYFTIFDTSRLSHHYITAENQIVSWTWARSPYRLVWAARSDGTFLSQTFVAKEELYAWTDHSTKGFVEDMESISEDKNDRVYAVIRRTRQGVEKRYIERMALRDSETVEGMFSVDSGLTTQLTYPAATISIETATEPVIVTATAGVFSAGDVGKILRAGKFKGKITTFTSSTEVEVSTYETVSSPIPEITNNVTFKENNWSLASESTTFSGLHHLEGETVEILADGKEQPEQAVTGGMITLDAAASQVTVGLGFTGEIRILPPTAADAILEHRWRNANSVAVRLHNARGLEFGDGDLMYPINEEASLFDNAPGFETGMRALDIIMDYDYEATLSIKKMGPVSATVLGLVVEHSFGDG